MDLKTSIEYALNWVEECKSFKSGQDFIEFVYDYIFSLWDFVKLDKYKNIKLHKNVISLELSILGYTLKLEDQIDKVIILKKHKNIESEIGKYFVYAGEFQIKSKKVKYFHPKYIDVLLEEAFNEFFIISKKMSDREFYVEG